MDLYSSDELCVRFTDVPAGSRDVCVVTFDSFNDVEKLDRPGFGEGFLLSRGIAAIHVVSRQNLWYQEPDLPQALGAIREFTQSFGRVLTYGSSMGGYAAIRFGAAVGATTAIAISPQFSIDPDEAGFEIRWKQSSETIAFRHRVEHFPRVGRVIVFFDPYDLDAQHAQMIAELYPTVPVRLPYAGHPAGAFLLEAGLLTDAVEAICADRFDAAALEAEARRRRRRSGQYLFSLARRVMLRRIETKFALARLAVKACPLDAIYASFLGVVLDRLGRWDEAETFHRAALSIQPNHPYLLDAYCRFLLRQARFVEAYEVARKSYGLAPRAGFATRGLVLSQVGTGRARAALEVMRDARSAGGFTFLGTLRDIFRLLRWRVLGRPRRGAGRFPAPPVDLKFGLEVAPGRRKGRRLSGSGWPS